MAGSYASLESILENVGCGIIVVDYDKKHYDIVAITSQISVATRAQELANKFKAKGSYVVLGGYYPTYMPEEAAEYGDTIIIGAGEYSWPKFLKDYKDGNPQKIYNTLNHQLFLILYIHLSRKLILAQVKFHYRYHQIYTIPPSSVSFKYFSLVKSAIPDALSELNSGFEK